MPIKSFATRPHSHGQVVSIESGLPFKHAQTTADCLVNAIAYNHGHTGANEAVRGQETPGALLAQGQFDTVISAHPCLIIFATSNMKSIVGQAHSRYRRWQITASVHETALLWFAVPTTAWLQYLVQTLLSMRLELADRLCSAPQQTKQNSTAALQLHHS